MAKRTMAEEMEKYCVFCEYGTPLPADKDGNEMLICTKKGLVKGNSVCRKFSYDPLKREPRMRPELPEVDAIDIDEL